MVLAWFACLGLFSAPVLSAWMLASADQAVCSADGHASLVLAVDADDAPVGLHAPHCPLCALAASPMLPPAADEPARALTAPPHLPDTGACSAVPTLPGETARPRGPPQPV